MEGVRSGLQHVFDELCVPEECGASSCSSYACAVQAMPLPTMGYYINLQCVHSILILNITIDCRISLQMHVYVKGCVALWYCSHSNA